MGQSTTSLSLSDPAATIAVAPTAESGGGIFCATLRMHLAHNVWKQLSKQGSVYLSPQLWNVIHIALQKCSPTFLTLYRVTKVVGDTDYADIKNKSCA